MRNVEEAGVLDGQIVWKNFSLEEVNLPHDQDADELWESADRRRGLLPAAAAKWAEAQGSDTFRTVQLAFYEANHTDRKKIGKPEVTSEVLTGAGLDGDAITAEIRSEPKWLDAVRADHDEGVELDVFGVPTFVFPDAKPVFLRLLEITEGDRAVEIWRRFVDDVRDPVFHEFKRPM